MKSDFKKIIEKWIPQNTKVLDLGCGDGDLLEYLKNCLLYTSPSPRD